MKNLVRCADGVVVARRLSEVPAEAASVLHVRPPAPVDLPTQAPVEAQRSDGVVWRRHWLLPERLVIDFVNVAVVAIDNAGGVVFDRLLADDMEEHLLLDHVLPIVLARRGRLVLHGGVVSRDGAGIVLVGATGAGKSTFTAYLWQQSWTVGGDDGAVIHLDRPLRVEPTYATIRLSYESADMLRIDLGTATTATNKIRLAPDAAHPFRQEPVRLALVAIIEPGEDDAQTEFRPLGAVDAHARLFGCTFHADLARDGTLPNVIDGLAEVVESVPVGVLTIPRGPWGLAAGERALRSVVDDITAVGGGS